MSALRQLVALVVAVAVVAGCATGSTRLRLRDGRYIQGRIVRSDADTFWVEWNGRERSVKRKDIAYTTQSTSYGAAGAVLAIGSTLAVIGGTLVAFGASRGAFDEHRQSPDPGCQGRCDEKRPGESTATAGLWLAVSGVFLVGMGVAVAAHESSGEHHRPAAEETNPTVRRRPEASWGGTARPQPSARASAPQPGSANTPRGGQLLTAPPVPPPQPARPAAPAPEPVPPGPDASAEESAKPATVPPRRSPWCALRGCTKDPLTR